MEQPDAAVQGGAGHAEVAGDLGSRLAYVKSRWSDRNANETAAARGKDLQSARDAADTATGKYDTLTKQASTTRSEAAGAEEQIAAWSAYLSRSAGRDLTASITADSDTLLERLGTASKVTDTMNVALEDAATRAGTAEALTKQADAARRERDRTVRQPW